MKAMIRPGTARGTVAAPPSKSMAHRLLICAGLADGASTVEGVDPSEDILATLDCLESLGASVRRENGAVFLHDPPLPSFRSADAPGRQSDPAEPSALCL